LFEAALKSRRQTHELEKHRAMETVAEALRW